MSKKKLLILSTILLLIIVSIIGATYAYYNMVVSGNDNINANAKKYEIIYRGGTHISGSMQAVLNKEAGQNTTVEIGLSKNSAIANATIFIYINKISDNLAIKGFNWAVYRVEDATETYINSGNFYGANTGDQIAIINNYQISEKLTKFKVYLWIDGNNSDNSIAGGSFDGYIGANTDALTGNVKR